MSRAVLLARSDLARIVAMVMGGGYTDGSS